MAIDYTDGSIMEQRILEILRTAEDVSSSAHIAYDQYDSWPVRYHLAPERANLLRHLDFSGTEVLELGAGMGAVSRYIAEQDCSLTVVEGTVMRYSCLMERLRGLDNWEGQVGNIQHVTFDKKFDVVCVLGVLEYAQMYMEPTDSYPGSHFNLFLDKVSELLTDEGVIILAIENKLGLKYWSGAGEDHSNKLFDGISGYSFNKTPKTFSRMEMYNLFQQISFSSIDAFYPFPDYKLPSSVLSHSFVKKFPNIAAEIATRRPFENYATNRPYFFSEHLVLQNIAQSGLFEEFTNSFLFVAARNPSSGIRQGILRRLLNEKELAWHYALDRQTPVETVFNIDSASKILVSKRLLFDHSKQTQKYSFDKYTATLNATFCSGMITGQKLLTVLANSAYYNNWDDFLNQFEAFLTWSFERWSLPPSDDDVIAGEAIDAILSNAAISHDTYDLFDLELALDSPLPKSWFIFRNVQAITPERYLFSNDAPFSSFKKLYELLCEVFSIPENFDRDLSLEAQFQETVLLSEHVSIYDAIQKSLTTEFKNSSLPNDPHFELLLRSHYQELIKNKEKQIEHKDNIIKDMQNTVSWKITAPIRWFGRLILEREGTKKE